jgi:hypothetical protein
MSIDCEISLATPDDIPGILAVQEPNLPDSGGSLSVRQTADWFKHAVLEKSVVVGRIWPGLRCGDRAWKRPRGRAVQRIAEPYAGALGHDIRTGR